MIHTFITISPNYTNNEKEQLNLANIDISQLKNENLVVTAYLSKNKLKELKKLSCVINITQSKKLKLH